MGSSPIPRSRSDTAVLTVSRSRSTSPDQLKRFGPSSSTELHNDSSQQSIPSVPNLTPPTPPGSASTQAVLISHRHSRPSPPTNSATVNSILTTTAAAAGPKKLTKWLSTSTNRSRSKSIGSSSLANPESESPPMPPSRSSSDNSQPGITRSPSVTSSSPSISPSVSPSTHSKRSFGQRFKTGRRRPSGEILEEWTDATLTPAAAERDEFDHAQLLVPDRAAEQNGGLSASQSGAGKTPGRFSLKRSKSNLRLFGKANQDDHPSTPPTDCSAGPTAPRPAGTHIPFKPPSTMTVPTRVEVERSQGPSGQPCGGIGAAGAGSATGRLGGWFSSMLNNSPSSVNLPANSDTRAIGTSPSASSSSASLVGRSPKKDRLSAPTSTSSPARLGPMNRMLDKAVQYFLDTDGTADRCPDDIWVLGVKHKGWTPEDLDEGELTVVDSTLEGKGGKHRRTGSSGLGIMSKGKRNEHQRHSTPPLGHQGSRSPSPSPASSPSPRHRSSTSPALTHGWPASFYADFYSRIALTYRSGFPGIPCAPAPTGGVHGVFTTLGMSLGRPNSKQDGLTSDTGWGCMLRTGQSLLANTLVDVHLGRDWRRPLPTSPTQRPASPSPDSSPPVSPVPQLGRYARLLSLFLDDPSPLSPFSVHRFALEGKQLGKEVGEWFGPSTAAGAIKTLVHGFPAAGLAVCSVVDGSVYRTEVQAASGGNWQTPVLLLIGLRLGIDGVNPIYHEGVQKVFEFPQSVGIAGGRPSSSYYFVGAQAGALFYIDPHHPKPAVAHQPLPSELHPAATATPLSPSNAQQNADALKLESFFGKAYSDAALGSYHSERVRKMALASMDPSMLLGFLIRDEADWVDFQTRVQDLASAHSPIFALADSPPAWMKRSTGAGSFAGGGGGGGLSAEPSRVESGDHTTEAGEEAEYSEPEDWELESTDASGMTGSNASLPASLHEETIRRVEQDDGEWEEDVAQTPGLSPPEFVITSSSTSVSTPAELVEPSIMAGSGDALPADDRSWHTAFAAQPSSTRASSPSGLARGGRQSSGSSQDGVRTGGNTHIGDSVVVVSTGGEALGAAEVPLPLVTPTESTRDLGGRAVLVDVERRAPVRQESLPVRTLEEGWEGVEVTGAERDGEGRGRGE